VYDAYDNEDQPRGSAKWLRPELVAPWWEIVLVLCVMLGPFACSALNMAMKGQVVDFLDKIINTRGLARNTAVESGLLAVFLFYLRWRGWRPADFKIRIDWVGTLIAVPLACVGAFANIFTSAIVQVAIAALAPHPHGLIAAIIAGSPKIIPHHIELAWLAIFVGSTVNAYLEELVFMGYAFHQFAAKRNVLFALLIMVFLRMLLHTYKGPAGMLGIGAFSFVYGLTYLKTRRLWPLILGHNLTDIAVFTMVKLVFGR
jgi:membrane protease YdiL (CAAX protease family)